MMLLTMDNNVDTADDYQAIHRNNNENVDDVNNIDTILISWISSLFIATFLVQILVFQLVPLLLLQDLAQVLVQEHSFKSCFIFKYIGDAEFKAFTKLLFQSTILHYSFDQSNILPHLFGYPYYM